MTDSEKQGSKEAMGQAAICALTLPQTDSPKTSGENNKSLSSQLQDSHSVMELLDDLLTKGVKLNSNDVLTNMRRVYQENMQLKDTLYQNNMALCQQMKMLHQWNLQVEKMRQDHQQKMSTIQTALASSEEENKALKASFNDMKGSNPRFCELEAFVERFRGEISALEARLQTCLTEKESLSTIRANLEEEVTTLKCELAARRGEYEKALKDTLRNQSAKQETPPMSADSHVQTENAPNADRLLIESKKINSDLMQQLQEARKEIEILKSKLIDAKEESSKTGLSSGIKKALRDSDVVENGQEASDDLLEMNRLRTDVRNLKKELSETRGKSELHFVNDHLYETKIKSIQENLDEATAKIISYEELVASKNEEISRLKRDSGQIKAELRERISDSETVAVLRAQVEVYQSDFRAEREAREAMVNERERLRDEAKHLQMRNSQLIDELDSYQRKLFSQRPEQQASSASDEPKDHSGTSESAFDWGFSRFSASPEKKVETKREEAPTQEIDENLLYCPKCNKTFKELRPLEEHVNQCLDED